MATACYQVVGTQVVPHLSCLHPFFPLNTLEALVSPGVVDYTVGMSDPYFASVRFPQKVSTAFATLFSALLFVGCGKQTSPEVTVAKSTNAVLPAMQANPLESTNVLRSFLVRGVVRELPADGETVVVKHEEIPDYMAKMTMAFNVRDKKELRGLQPGQAITFNLRATEEESWIENIRPVGTNAQARPTAADPSSTALLHVAEMKRGDLLPDAELLAEDGRTIKLSDFEGRALAFTFIFTRCPLPDYCPRMNQHFSRARELLMKRPGGATNWQFLSISFDPEFDKPEVLTRYAYSYRGQNVDRWLFAAAPTNVMAAFVNQLDFRFANEGGSFLHNLRTVVLDPQRRIYRQFDGNKWKTQELADALAEAAMRKNLVESAGAGTVSQ